MTAEPPSPVQREGVALFGRVAAGLSHELSNVFNIINELAGLEQDIVSASKGDGSAATNRIADLAARIKAQVARGEEFNRLLHQLGHSVDKTCQAFDLGELLKLLGGLEARKARLARFELTVRLPQRPVTLTGDPFALLLALDACMSGAMEVAAADRRVEVRAEDADGEVRVVVESAEPPAADGEDPLTQSALRLGAAAWRAAITMQTRPGEPYRITLALPVHHPGSTPQNDVSPREEP